MRVNEAFYMLVCRGLHYMFDMSRFVRVLNASFGPAVHQDDTQCSLALSPLFLAAT